MTSGQAHNSRSKNTDVEMSAFSECFLFFFFFLYFVNHTLVWNIKKKLKMRPFIVTVWEDSGSSKLICLCVSRFCGLYLGYFVSDLEMLKLKSERFNQNYIEIGLVISLWCHSWFFFFFYIYTHILHKMSQMNNFSKQL